jgi:tetratricopeptide (TPR) repeat protein
MGTARPRIYLTLALTLASGAWAQKSAELLVSQGRYQDALTDLQTLSEAVKQTAQWHLIASRAYDGLGDPKRAIEEAQTGLAIDPHNPAVHLQLGQIFLSWNTPQPAFDVFTSALKLFPESTPILLGRGIALMDLGRYNEAANDFKVCLKRKPDLGIAFESLETTYLKAGQLEDAVNAATQYSKDFPNDYRGHYYLAAATDQIQGDPNVIQAELNETIRCKPDYVPANVLEAKMLSRAGDATRALAILEGAVRQNPSYPSAHIELAKLYRKMGRNDEAVRELKILEKVNADRGRSLSYHQGATPSNSN